MSKQGTLFQEVQIGSYWKLFLLKWVLRWES